MSHNNVIIDTKTNKEGNKAHQDEKCPEAVEALCRNYAEKVISLCSQS